MKNVAILGLGIVGSRARQRLIDANYTVTCWSRTQRGREGEKESPEEAVAGAALVSIFLKDAPMVREIFSRALPELQEGAVVLNHATVDLETTLWLAEQCAAKGHDFIDAPFTGSKDAATAGQLLYYTAGDESLIASLSDYLAVSFKGSIYCGEIGTATVTKLGTNLISACTIQAMSEAMAIAVKYGVKPEVFAEAATRNTSGSTLMATKYPRMIEGVYDAHFTLENMLKDSRYAIALGDASEIDIPAIKLVSQRMAQLCEDGYADLDFSALAKAYEG
jgi:3-hydroxyisobutyrate dehydrogenase-like beta-hydroxyacid dehydrogenase